MAAILTQGKTKRRDDFKTRVTHMCFSDDGTAFSAAHTGINPAAGTTSTHVEAVTEADVDAATVDFTVTINGATEMTNKSVVAIGLSDGVGVRQATGAGGTHTGGSVVGTATISRSVRTLGIGVESTDTHVFSVRSKEEDNSA